MESQFAKKKQTRSRFMPFIFSYIYDIYLHENNKLSVTVALRVPKRKPQSSR